MKLTHGSGLPEDIQLLRLVAHFETHSRLRIRIVDATNDRYEVDVLETKIPEYSPRNRSEYKFTINSKVPGFSVVRKSTREVNLRVIFFFIYPSSKSFDFPSDIIFFSGCWRIYLCQSVPANF